jgi:hypothetical protein
MLEHAQYIGVQIVDRRSSLVSLIDNLISSAPELLDPVIDAWKCVSSIAIDCLSSLMNLFGWAFFLPEKLDHRSLLEFAHLALEDVKDSSHPIKGDHQGDREGTSQYHP